MKNLLVTALLVALYSPSQAQYFEWAKELPHASRGRDAHAMAVDPAGNMFTVGSKGVCSPCPTDGFVLKQNVFGTFVWEYIVTGALGDTVQCDAVAADPAGNTFILASSTQYVILGTDTAFSGKALIKLDANKNPQWLIDGLTGKIAADTAGSVYVAGPDSTRKFNKNGVWQWANKSLSNAAIGVDFKGRCYIANFDSVIKFNNAGVLKFQKAIGGSSIAVSYNGKIFLLKSNALKKLNSNGVIEWKNQTIGGIGLTVDLNNAVYVLVDSNTVRKVSATGSGSLWTRQTENAAIVGIGVDSNRNVYMSGNYNILDVNGIPSLCPFKLLQFGTWTNVHANQAFTARINTNNTPPFQAGIFTGSIPGGPPAICNRSFLNIPFSYCLAKGSDFIGSNEFRAQISSNNFVNFTDIGRPDSAFIPESITPGAGYRIRVVATDPNPNIKTYINSSPTTGDFLAVSGSDVFMVTPTNTVVCANEMVTLTAGVSNAAAGGATAWYRNGVFAGAGTASPPFEFNASQGGDYYFTYTTTCTMHSDTITVKQRNKPAATITPQGPTSFCAGDSVVLSANFNASFSYKWKKNGTYTGDVLPDLTVFTSGVYKVEVTKPNGCSKTSLGETVSVVCREPAHDSQPEAFLVKVSPVPFTDQLNIRRTGAGNQAYLQVVDMKGSIWAEYRFTENDPGLLFDTGKWPPGIYFMHLYQDGGRIVKKLVKI